MDHSVFRTKLCLVYLGVMMLAPFQVFSAEKPNVNPKIDVLQLDTSIDNMVTGSVMRDNDMLSYCLNISDIATETRTAILRKNLKSTEEKIDTKLDNLAKKITELRKWTLKREKFLDMGRNSLIKIFQTMRADAAAQQLSEMGPLLAASIIVKLPPKNSSAILTEMKPPIAAKIATILTSAISSNE